MAYSGSRGDIAALVSEYGDAGWVYFPDDPAAPRFYVFASDWNNPGARTFSPDDVTRSIAAGGDGLGLGDFAAWNWDRYPAATVLNDNARGYYLHPAMAGTGTRCVYIDSVSVVRKGPFQKTWLDKITYAAAVGMIAVGTAGLALQVAGVIGAGSVGTATSVAPAVAESAAASATAAPVVSTAVATPAAWTLAEVTAGAKTAVQVASAVKAVTTAVSTVSNSGIDWANVAQAAQNANAIGTNTAQAKTALDGLMADPKTMYYLGAAVLAVVLL